MQVVDTGGHERVLQRGESYASHGAALMQEESAPLQREAAELAARRARAAPHVQPVTSSLTPVPATAKTREVEPAPLQVPASARPSEVDPAESQLDGAP